MHSRKYSMSIISVYDTKSSVLFMSIVNIVHIVSIKSIVVPDILFSLQDDTLLVAKSNDHLS